MNHLQPIEGQEAVAAEVRQANVADTLMALQSIIERNAVELARIKNELKLKRESLKSVFDNDRELSVAQVAAEEVVKQVKKRKTEMTASPQVITLKTDISDLNEQKKEIEETLNNHLLNLYQVTGTKTFDTSSGQQFEFTVQAKVSSKQLALFN